MTITADQDCSASDDIEKPPDDDQEATADAGRRIANGGARPWKRYARIALVVAVYAGAVGLAGGLGWKLWDEHTVSQAGQAAERTAVNYAQVLTSIDSNQVDQNFSAVLDGATGEFKDIYTKASAQLRQLLIDNKATAHGTVVASAIQSQTKNKVVVLLMVDQTVSNAVRPDGRVDRSRMKVTMENVGGQWLASKVELP
ncbi:Mce protein [Mycobacterium colombiense]|uniref:Mce protein n=1 Tax=Mycobacterium [tuberculosis] TKK-01-0051 TaxID=1324261 RepID=A0A051ULR2_9MYCO|nr:hypothetical protein [Mycobacterium colombiense]KBZ69526.1 hypothetical protein K875_00244 [Mycobacterium [tuberculosis] TKK-01-0051]